MTKENKDMIENGENGENNENNENNEDLGEKTPKKTVKPKEVDPRDDLIAKQSQVIDKLLSRVEDFEDKFKRLEYAADKGRLVNYDIKTRGKIEPTVSIRRYSVSGNNELDDSAKDFVVGWKLTKNLVEKINGIWCEDQRVTLYFAGGKQLDDVKVIDFERNFTLVPCRIKDTVNNSTGTSYVVDPEGYDVEIKINATYVN